MANWIAGCKRAVVALVTVLVLSLGSASYAAGLAITASGCLSFVLVVCGGPTYNLTGKTGWHFTASIGIGIPTGLSGSVMVGTYTGKSPRGGSSTVQGGIGLGGYMGSDGNLASGMGVTTPSLSWTLNKTW